MASNTADSDSSSESDSDVPAAEVCEKLCAEFSSVTCTDSAMSMMFLQQNGWNLQLALEKYFGEDVSETNSSASVTLPSSRVTDHMSKTNKTSESSCHQLQHAETVENKAPLASADLASVVAKDENPFRIRILSWNIDGLDLGNIQTRTRAACDEMTKINPDVIYLQEVVPQTCETVKNMMNNKYLCIAAGEESYFTMMLLNRSTVMHESHQIIPFFSSKMGRNILECEANIKGIPFYLMTSHLESTAAHADERLRQMKKCLSLVDAATMSRVAIFGGDLNARDKELAKLTVPSDVVDVWEYCGKRKDAQYTWDTMRNDNLEMGGGKFKPRCRFDRFFFRPDDKKSVKPVYFELMGLERLASCRRFASDHWGILSHYNITA